MDAVTIATNDAMTTSSRGASVINVVTVAHGGLSGNNYCTLFSLIN